MELQQVQRQRLTVTSVAEVGTARLVTLSPIPAALVKVENTRIKKGRQLAYLAYQGNTDELMKRSGPTAMIVKQARNLLTLVAKNHVNHLEQAQSCLAAEQLQ